MFCIATPVVSCIDLLGMQAALTRTVNTLARKAKTLKENDANLAGDHIREGLSCVISVKVCKVLVCEKECSAYKLLCLASHALIVVAHENTGVQVPEPEFEGQTKTRLGNPEVRKIVDACVAKVLHPKSTPMLFLPARCIRQTACGSREGPLGSWCGHTSTSILVQKSYMSFCPSSWSRASQRPWKWTQPR